MPDMAIGNHVRARNNVYDFTSTVLDVDDEEVTVLIDCDQCENTAHEVDHRDVRAADRG